MGCMHACPCLLHSRVEADPNACVNVYWLSSIGSKQSSNGGQGGPSPWPPKRSGRAAL